MNGWKGISIQGLQGHVGREMEIKIESGHDDDVNVHSLAIDFAPTRYTELFFMGASPHNRRYLRQDCISVAVIKWAAKKGRENQCERTVGVIGSGTERVSKVSKVNRLEFAFFFHISYSYIYILHRFCDLYLSQWIIMN